MFGPVCCCLRLHNQQSVDPTSCTSLTGPWHLSLHTLTMATTSSELQGKVVVITGASSSGIGRATALVLAQHGAKVVLGARREQPLAELVGEIQQAGGQATYCVTDVKQRQDVHNLVQHAVSTYGRIDVLVSNAGVMPVAPLDELHVEDWENTVDINIKGVLYGIAAALPLFRKQESGHFINIASTAAHKVAPNMAVYCGTKIAVRAISEGLRQEAGAKLRVTVISPGMTNTDFASGIQHAGTREKLSAMRDEIAMPPTAVAEAIWYAISQPASIDVGEIIIRPTAQA